MLADFVLHGADGFVEGVDDEVAGSDADYLAEVGGVVVDARETAPAMLAAMERAAPAGSRPTRGEGSLPRLSGVGGGW